jgi:hypothetical protein
VDRVAIGLTALALAPLAWLLGIAAEGTTQYVVPVLLQAIGLGLAAWALPTFRPRAAATGFALAAVGILLFYDLHLFSGPPAFAGFVFFAGCLACCLGAARVAYPILAGGLFTMAAAGVLWVLVDTVGGGWVWQPGNLLCFGGALFAGMGAGDER